LRFHLDASFASHKGPAIQGRRGRIVDGILQNLERVWSNLLRLGPRRLAALGLAGLAVFAATGLAGYYLSRPAQEVLYAGLDRQDVARIGAALGEAGIAFDVSPDGASVSVRYGQSGPARMLLAEKGLPNGSTGGYELFDKLGSLGLTSFMQEVTRVRAIEGELARTIQLIRGVRAARVHIVMPDEGSFRRARQPPSASVILRTDSPSDAGVAAAIRHLVAAAVPGMKTDQVTIVGSDGALLATQDDPADAAPGRTRSLEKSLSNEIQDNIRKTLSSYLSLKNFQVSVSARLNTDKRQVNETIYNPESRVERSVRVIKENQSAQNATQSAATSVERNLPQDNAQKGSGKQSNEENQKREEVTNFEVSSKTITTVSSGYAIESLSVAVLVNRAGLVASLGGQATPEAIAAQIKEIEQLVASAAGLRRERGDAIKISAVDFVEAGRDLDPVPAPGVAEHLLRQSGALVSAGSMLLVTALVVWFGVRPIARAPPAPRGRGRRTAPARRRRDARADRCAVGPRPDGNPRRTAPARAPGPLGGRRRSAATRPAQA
jgi:flagellar M-ring protein FliF